MLWYLSLVRISLLVRLKNLDATLFMSSRGQHQAKDRNHGMERTPAKERSRAKREARPNHKLRRARSEETALERASMRRANLPRRREKAKATARKVSQVENPAKIGKVYVDPVAVIQTREIHTFFRAPRGCSWNVLFVQMSPTASRWRRSLFLASHVEAGVQAEYMSSWCTPWPFFWLVRTHDAKHHFRGKELPDLSRLTQANRDTKNKLRWRVKLDQDESERPGSRTWWTSLLCLATHRKIRKWNFPRPENVVYRGDRENENPKTDGPRKFLLPKRTWPHTDGTQTDERLGLTAIPEWQRLCLCIDGIARCICPSWGNFGGKGTQRNHSARHQFAEHEVPMEWAKTVSVHEGIQELKKELLFTTSRFGMEGVIGEFKTNLQTHKPPGHVNPGAIHSATKNLLVPLGKYVACRLRKVLSRDSHSERGNFRYRDDIFLIARSGTLTKHWKHAAVTYKSPCLIEGWVVSSESVVHLDTELYKGPRWKTMRMLDSRPHIKPSSSGVPLSLLSSHPKWVHNWWPLGEIRRFARRSTQHKVFITTRDRFIERLEKFNYDENRINQKSWVHEETWRELRETEIQGSNDVVRVWASSCSVPCKRTRSDWKMEPNLVWSDQTPPVSENQSCFKNWIQTSGSAPQVERSTCHSESAQCELRRREILRGTSLSDLTQFGRLFILPWEFLPCRTTSDLHVSLGPAVLAG